MIMCGMEWWAVYAPTWISFWCSFAELWSKRLEIRTRKTLKWAHRLFATTENGLFYFLYDIIMITCYQMMIKWQCSHIDSKCYSLCWRFGDDVLWDRELRHDQKKSYNSSLDINFIYIHEFKIFGNLLFYQLLLFRARYCGTRCGFY